MKSWAKKVKIFNIHLLMNGNLNERNGADLLKANKMFTVQVLPLCVSWVSWCTSDQRWLSFTALWYVDLILGLVFVILSVFRFPSTIMFTLYAYVRLYILFQMVSFFYSEEASIDAKLVDGQQSATTINLTRGITMLRSVCSYCELLILC